MKKIENVVVNTAKTERKKVILRDCDGSSFHFLLTNEQISLLDLLRKNDLLYDVRWEVLSDEDWEKV